MFRPREEITGRDYPVPLLITESNGHMFPTKRFDTESRLLEHAMRHLRVMNEALGRGRPHREISWCAFDYNTHGGFGSGDKICYHGVSDMFRIPKYAGLALMSQRPLEQGAVLEPLSLVSRGERDGGGSSFWTATNCDCVRVYKNGALVGDFYPNRALFPNLPHPPVVINHLMPANLELPLEKSSPRNSRRFIAEQAKQGILPDLLPEDYPYLEELSEKAGWTAARSPKFCLTTPAAGGQAENNLRLEGRVGDQTVVVREAGRPKPSPVWTSRPTTKAYKPAGIPTTPPASSSARSTPWAISAPSAPPVYRPHQRPGGGHRPRHGRPHRRLPRLLGQNPRKNRRSPRLGGEWAHVGGNPHRCPLTGRAV